MRAIGDLVGAVAAALALASGTTGTAGAATLKASYQLQGTRASLVAGAPDLADIGAANRFKTETVDGKPRQVLAFRKGDGVSLRTAGLVDPTSHSIAMLFRLSDTSGYRRLLDFSGGASDNGLYDLDGKVVIYLGEDSVGSQNTVLEDSYALVTLTSEATLAGTQWTAVYVNGSPVVATTTTSGFGLGSGVLRFFRDNTHGSGGRGEQSAGALACALVYDGALTAAEVRQEATDPSLCPAPRSTPHRSLPFKTGDYEGTTSQHLPISFTVGETSVHDISFEWRAKCADGHVHTNGISLDQARIRNGRFSAGGTLNTGGHARVTGRLRGNRASGRLSRWGNSAFNTSCPARGVRWRARLAG